MRHRIPSPTTVLAGLALFVALGGTSIAAVSFARNAGAVDGRSAVGSGATLHHAAGKLVATDTDGRLLGRYVKGVSHASPFTVVADVPDNATGAAQAVASYSRVGALTATCLDQGNAAGVEDPRTVLTFTNTTGAVVNYTSRQGVAPATVVAMQPSTTQTITVNGSNTFEIEASIVGVDARFTGTVRQDGQGTPDAKCLVYGNVTLVY
jgi:hypothetical protein